MAADPREVWAFLLAAAVCGCAESERPPRVEDVPRAMAPIPACIMPLPARTSATAGTMRNLREEQYWQLVFPSFDLKQRTLGLDSVTCTGAHVFDAPIFRGGATHGTPVQVQEGDIIYGNGGDHMRIVWMRTHSWPDGSEAGPIALVRTQEDFAEVYAVGSFRRSSTQSTFQAERLGTEFLISGTDDGCQGLPLTTACEAKITLLLPRFGQLVQLAALDTERRAYATGTEPGVTGNIEYRLTASPKYTDDGVQLFEQVKASDSAGRVVHKTELERVLVLRDGKMEPSSDSLWGRVFPAATAKP